MFRTRIKYKKQQSKIKNKQKKKKKKNSKATKYHNVGTVLRYNRNIIEIAAKSIPLHLTHERTLYWLGTVVRITQVLWVQASPLKISY